MSREIRFRCWNNCLRKYIPEDGLMDSFGECLKEDHLYIEQYTGLTDKNGKEIYEGDIITTCCGKAKVYFDEESCSYKIWMKHGLTMPLVGKKSHRHLEYEVIGNVHENPELLKGKYEVPNV